jgi:hypothetical protein
MADFCNRCATEMWGDDFPPEIDVQKIAESLEPNTYMPVLCEGCRMVAVGKNEKQEIMIAHVIEEGQVDDLVEWTTYSDWESRPLPF